MSFKINDEKTTKKLEEIRLKVGGKKRFFIPPMLPGRIDEPIGSDGIETIIHPSGLLIKNGKPVFAYIRDHSVGINIGDEVWKHKKIHFTVCKKLIEMKNAGRFQSRYRMTNRDDNEYYVEYANRKTREVPLHPCKHCIKALDYSCFNTKGEREKTEIIEKFDAKEALSIMNVHFRLFEIYAKNIRGEHVSSGYANNHKKISERYRKSKNYTCEICDVNLSEYRHLTDMHHKDGDKSNNVENNLQCLCKLCHRAQHSHYRVNMYHKFIIESERKKQNV